MGVMDWCKEAHYTNKLHDPPDHNMHSRFKANSDYIMSISTGTLLCPVSFLQTQGKSKE